MLRIIILLLVLLVNSIQPASAFWIWTPETNQWVNPKFSVKETPKDQLDYALGFYQAKEFWASDDINVLYPKFNLNKYAAMFICTIIEKEKYRYNYGRKWYAERMIESVIKLPIKMNLSPDWEYIESFIKSLPYSKNI